MLLTSAHFAVHILARRTWRSHRVDPTESVFSNFQLTIACVLAPLQERHEQDHAKATQLLGLGLPRRLPKLQGAPDAQQGFAGNLSGLAAGTLSAIKHQTGQPG